MNLCKISGKFEKPSPTGEGFFDMQKAKKSPARGGARIKTVWDNHRIPYNMKFLSMNSVAFQGLQK